MTTPAAVVGSSSYKYYLLFILLLMYAFSYIDRHIFAIVMQDIKMDLELSDTQLGLLSGIAFSFFYAIMGLPIAFMTDRFDRIKILSICGGLCCAMVALCGLVGSFFQLALVRVGVAVGEAGTVPPAHSLIPDYFVRHERARAVAIFMLGASLSTVIGNMLGGWINEVYGWRMAFILLSIPGGLISILAWLTLREPRRSMPVSTSSSRFQLKESFRAFTPLWRITTIRHLSAALVTMTFFSSGFALWIPTFFIRHHHVNKAELGIWIALIYGVGSAIGTIAGGDIASRFAANRENLQLRAIAVLSALATVFGLGMLWTPDTQFAFLFLAFYKFILGLTFGPTLSIIQTIVPSSTRATALALILIIMNVVGLGFGPLALGILSDLLTAFHGIESLRYAMAIMLPGCFWMAAHFWWAARTVEADIASAEKQEASLSNL